MKKKEIFLNDYAKVSLLTLFLRFKTKNSYGCCIMVALFCSNRTFYSCYCISVDLPKQNHKQEQARQQVLNLISDFPASRENVITGKPAAYIHKH